MSGNRDSLFTGWIGRAGSNIPFIAFYVRQLMTRYGERGGEGMKKNSLGRAWGTFGRK